jgi:hypothetical protein
MREALDMLIEGVYSGVIINADDFEYLPLLKIMRVITAIPIIVSVTRYDEAENAAGVFGDGSPAAAYACGAGASFLLAAVLAWMKYKRQKKR